MKKLFTSFCFSIALASSVFAQVDTLFFENFQYDSLPSNFIAATAPDQPLGDNLNPDWVNMDFDGISDESGGDRPSNWFLTYAIAQADSFYMPLVYTDSLNVVCSSGSWTNSTELTQDYLITPKFWVADDQAVLRWKSAPLQTPRYLDGYQVLVSITGNNDYDFTDTIAVFAEFEDATDLNDTNTYTFSPGIRHTLLEDNDGDILRYKGILQEWEVSLADYAGKNIHIAFLHGCTDDNLLTLDDILVLGTGNVGINEQEQNTMTLGLNPNPASDIIQVNYNLAKTAAVTSFVYDINGKLIDSKNRGMQMAGQQQFTYKVADLAPGSYFFTLDTGKEKVTQKFVVIK